MVKKKWPLLLFFCILGAGILGSILVLKKPESRLVEITRDGEVLYRLDLRTAEDQTFEIDYGEGGNTVEIRDHQIRVKDADCPDQTCVRSGWLDSSLPIVCLPHHLVIRFAETQGAADTVAG